jgi:CubicO group peptidase (beta-lactamase class C family)
MRHRHRLALPALLALVLAATGATGARAQLPATAAARQQAVVSGLLQAVHLDGQPQQTFTLESRMRRYGVPGVSIAVIHDGKLDWASGYGLADVASGRKVTTATLFQAASMSKPVAALAALKLVQAGRLTLDENVNRVLREWKVPDNAYTERQPVTLRELLTHTAGMTVHGFAGYAVGEAVPTVVEVLDGAKPANSDPVRVDIQPGTRWRYSGGGYTVMQLLVTEQYGRPFPELMRREVLDPLGMHASTYQQPLPAVKRSLAATGYRSDGKPVEGKYHTYPEMAAAGLWTNASDYARYVMGVQRTFRGEAAPVLSRAMIDTMLTPGLGSWGLGPTIEGDADSLSFSHGGANEGFRSFFVGYLHHDDGIVVFTNSDAGSTIAAEIVRAAARVYGWYGFAPRTVAALALATGALDACAGRYHVSSGPDLTVVIRRDGDHLVLSLMGQDQELVPTTPDTFVSLDTGQALTFERDASGNVVAMRAGGLRADRVQD